MWDFMRELNYNVAATYRLKPGYYWLTTCVGFVIVGVALIPIGIAGLALSPFTSNAAPILLLVAMPLIIVLTTLLVAGGFGQVMVSWGVFSPTDAWYYATRSRYPLHWFKDQDAEAFDLLESSLKRLPDGWNRSASQIATKLQNQLTLELQVGHFLDGAAVKIVAHRTGTDDFLCWHIRQPRRFTAVRISSGTAARPSVEADGAFEEFLVYDRRRHR